MSWRATGLSAPTRRSHSMKVNCARFLPRLFFATRRVTLKTAICHLLKIPHDRNAPLHPRDGLSAKSWRPAGSSLTGCSTEPPFPLDRSLPWFRPAAATTACDKARRRGPRAASNHRRGGLSGSVENWISRFGQEPIPGEDAIRWMESHSNALEIRCSLVPTNPHIRRTFAPRSP